MANHPNRNRTWEERNADVASALHARYCIRGREDIQANARGGLDKHVMRAEGWTFDREIAPSAQYYENLIRIGRWDVIDRDMLKHGGLRPRTAAA